MNTADVDKLIDRAARAIGELPVPLGPPQAVVEKVRRAGANAASVRAGNRVGLRRTARYAVAATVFLMLTGLLVLVNRDTRGPGAAFAGMLQQLRQVRTVTYRAVTKQSDMPEETSLNTVEMSGKVSRHETLVRDPHAKDGAAAEIVDNISIYNNGRLLNLHPKDMTAVFTNYNTDGLPHQLSDADTLADLLTLSPLDVQSLGERTIEGRKVVGFHANRDRDHTTKRSIDVWIDPTTFLPVRVEEKSSFHYPDEAAMQALAKKAEAQGVAQLTPEEISTAMESWPEIKSERTITNIVFNVPKDEALFSTDAPAGYKVSVTEVK